MAESVSKICRICLEQLDENVHFYFLNNDNGSMLLSKMLDFLPEIDLDFMQNPISCNRCTITIEQIHEFKKMCLQTESVPKELKKQGKSFNGVISYVKKETEIERIKEEFLEDTFKDEYTINMAESVSKICRICLELLGENEHFYFLNNESMLLSRLLDFVPEIDLSFVQNPISCNRCTNTIDRIHEFKKLCVQTESVIKDLKMQQKSFDDVISYAKNDAGLETIKEEFLEDEFKDEPLIVDDCLQVNTDLPACIEVHLTSHTEKKPYKCVVCNYSSCRKSTLTRHIRTHTREKPYKCDVCDYRCSNQLYLKSHMHTHTKEKPYKCDMCDYRCNWKSNLINHIHHHTGEKPHKCDVCDYCCNNKSSLKSHIRTHTGEKLYKCDVCNYSYRSKSALTRHIITHTREKPYKCDVCGYCCNWKSNLINHIHTHTGEKPYKCDMCDYRCNHKSHLKSHIHTHTGEKPYKCDICNYCFRRKSTLTRHIHTHTREKRYKCEVCDYRCSNKSHLKSHIHTHTRENQ